MFAKWIPADGRFLFQELDNGGVEITAEEHAALIEAQAQGKVIQQGQDGRPAAMDQLPIPFATFEALYLTEVRTLRETILDRLAGIAGRASRSGNTTLAADADAAAEALLNITTAPAVLAARQAEDFDGLRAAVKATYKALAIAAPEALRTAFNGVEA